MKILIIGSGGREHAIAWKLKKDNPETGLYALPGNGGISLDAECLQSGSDTPSQIVAIASEIGADLTVVGPEVPLADGISDIFREKGLKIFGPVKKGAALEYSKLFAKEFMSRHGIPTAGFSSADSFGRAVKIIERKSFPCVIKYDGLAAGKGVLVSESMDESLEFLDSIYNKEAFGPAEKKIVVIEDMMTGTEMSYLVFTDTRNFVPMVPAKDHKRAFDGDKGPNTGGMGCYSPPTLFNGELEQAIVGKIVIPTLKGLEKDGIDYRGALYFGLMVTDKGPSVLEYNARFGDPETQVILPRMETCLAEVMEATAEGTLGKASVKWSDKKAVCVILASGGYPGKYTTGKEIDGLEEAENCGVTVFHAGTGRGQNGRFITSGGRVLGITSVDASMETARMQVYRAAEKIQFSGSFYRKDIALFSEP